MDIKIGDVYMIGNCPHKIVEITDKEVIFDLTNWYKRNDYDNKVEKMLCDN